MNSQSMPQLPVADIVKACPTASRVFDEYHIDYFCHGESSLEEACRCARVAPQPVVSALTKELARLETAGSPVPDWMSTSLSEISQLMARNHHHGFRIELPTLAWMFEQVVAALGQAYPRLAAARHMFHVLKETLESHMLKAENILFPRIQRLEANHSPSGARMGFQFINLRSVIEAMREEHQSMVTVLQDLRFATKEYKLAADVDPICKALLENLRELESQIHEYIHLGNHVLFPRAVELDG